jgi:hypothetical protein
MSAFLDALRAVIGEMPIYAPSTWVMSRKHYNMLIHAKYKSVKAVRRAKARKKRVRAKCGQ